MAVLLLVSAGTFEAIFLSTNQTLLQLSIPDHLRGRVTSIFSVNAGLGIIGGLLAGIGSDLFGGPKTITIILAGSASGLAVLIFIFSTTVRDYRLSQGIKSKVN
jgi:MFS family permease